MHEQYQWRHLQHQTCVKHVTFHRTCDQTFATVICIWCHSPLHCFKLVACYYGFVLWLHLKLNICDQIFLGKQTNMSKTMFPKKETPMRHVDKPWHPKLQKQLVVKLNQVLREQKHPLEVSDPEKVVHRHPLPRTIWVILTNKLWCSTPEPRLYAHPDFSPMGYHNAERAFYP